MAIQICVQPSPFYHPSTLEGKTLWWDLDFCKYNIPCNIKINSISSVYEVLKLLILTKCDLSVMII